MANEFGHRQKPSKKNPNQSTSQDANHGQCERFNPTDPDLAIECFINFLMTLIPNSVNTCVICLNLVFQQSILEINSL